jgi:F-type H+-transporting ATPase subunit epsilon
MAQTIKLQVVTPEKIVVNEDARIVMAPGTLGQFGVLAGHTPFLTSLKMGVLLYQDSQGKERYVFLSGGFAEALPDKVTVLAQSAERRKDIDVERAKAALERAQKRLQDMNKKDAIDYNRARIALERALQRIKLSETK